MFILRQTSLKMAILLHTVANWRFIMIIAVPLLKALMYGISASGAQGRDSTLSICHALLKNALLLSEIAKRPTFIFGNYMDVRYDPQ